jgi:putative protease
LAEKEYGTPELLAPAGSIDAFHAAIEAGADAIYCGLEDFNARLRAKNFSTKTLSILIPHAHSQKKKVYITLNTLLKNNEIEKALHILYQLDQLKADAVIITDPGLIHLAHEHFPHLQLHGSTQMTLHNLQGAITAERLGLKRIVLSRELTSSEIAAISKKSPVELEVFIHGALCYSISGLCLASSYFGGASGNRGRCTQVCRRKFTYNKTEAYCFSPDDFCAADFITFLSNNHIASLKIEGRMKSAEYVFTVVKAYREILDNTSDISSAKKDLAGDFGRPKSSFFLKGKETRGLIKASRPPGIGLYLGKVTHVNKYECTIDCNASLKPGDRIRIQPINGFDGVSATVKSCVSLDNGILITTNSELQCSENDIVYHTGNKNSINQIHSKTLASTSQHIHQYFKQARSLVQNMTPTNENASNVRPQLWCKIDSLDWLGTLLSSPCQHLLAALDYSELEKLITTPELLKPWRSRIVPCLPPFIPPGEINKWSGLITDFMEIGISTWCCSNIGHSALFSKKYTLIADSFIPVFNNFSWQMLQQLGFSMFTYSTEDEYLNLRNTIYPQGILCLYSHVPLFISRIRPAARLNTTILDPYSNGMFSYFKNDLYYTSAKKPLCITGKKSKLLGEGITHFSIDLSGMKPDPEKFWEILHYYKSSGKVPDSTLFNFKAGLK